MMEIQDELLRPNTVLMLLLLADILVPINKFSKFLQTESLDYTLLPFKLDKLRSELKKLQSDLKCGKYFAKAETFLSQSAERMEKARQLRGHSNIPVANIDKQDMILKEIYRLSSKMFYCKFIIRT